MNPKICKRASIKNGLSCRGFAQKQSWIRGIRLQLKAFWKFCFPHQGPMLVFFAAVFTLSWPNTLNSFTFAAHFVSKSQVKK